VREEILKVEEGHELSKRFYLNGVFAFGSTQEGATQYAT